jgi:hypothetical protein
VIRLDTFRRHCADMATAQHKPTCDGCVTDAERDLFAQMAHEVAVYQEAK